MQRRALRARLLSFRVRMGLIDDWLLHATTSSEKDKVMAGGTRPTLPR
jgi:hypothetical protein